MPRVFVGNWSGHDLSEAEPFGDLIYLTEGNQDIFQPARLAYNILRNGLDDFNEKEDYYLPSGSMVINFVVGALLVSKEINHIKLLIFNAKTQKYILKDWDVGYLSQEYVTNDKEKKMDT